MKESDFPISFWGYCVGIRARINSMTEKNMFQLHGSNAHTKLTVDEGRISNLCWFACYDWCYFCDSNKVFPLNREKLGIVIGPARGEGN